jgi:hypothetical protein
VSKRFWLPTQKGSEVWPRTTVPSPVVRFHGFPIDSAEAEEMRERFAPQINHFHRSQAQKYSLSPIENYRAHGVYPGLKMTYTNLQGQETINILVMPPKPEPKPEPESWIPWDWVQVDIEVPDVGSAQPEGNMYAFFAAYMRFPAHPTPSASDTMPFEDVAGEKIGTNDDGSTMPLLQFASGQPNAVATVASDEDVQIASLLLDVRNFHTFEEVSFDLYGCLTQPSEDFDPELGPVIDSVHCGNWDHTNNLLEYASSMTEEELLDIHDDVGTANLTGSEWDPAVISYNNVVMEVMPSELWDIFSPQAFGEIEYFPGSTFPKKITWRFAAWGEMGSTVTYPEDGSVGHEPHYEYVGDSPPTEALDPGPVFGLVRLAYAEVNYLFRPIRGEVEDSEITPGTRLCTISAAAFRGTPQWAPADYTTPGDVEYSRWEVRDIYPRQLPLGRIARDVLLEPGDPNELVIEHNNLTRLGSVHFYQKYGAVTFQRA